MPRQPQIPLSLQMTYLQLSKCNETCRTAKMGPPESVQTISSQHAHDIGEISNFIWLPLTAVREFCVPTRALCAHIFKFPGKVSAWLAWCGHTELSAWLAWSDSKFANIFSVCWLNTKNIFCTPWGGQILPILQFSLWHEHSRYVIWTESGFEAWWDPRGRDIYSAHPSITCLSWVIEPMMWLTLNPPSCEFNAKYACICNCKCCQAQLGEFKV